MSPFKAIIIDDEDSARETLRTILRRYHPEISVVGEADSVKTGIDALNKTADYEIVFLDVQLQDGTGFDILENFDERNFELIFTTAFDAHAVQAFELSATGYLLKPININQLGMTIERVKKLSRSGDDHLKQISALTSNFFKRDEHLNKLVIPTISGFEVVNIQDLVRCEGERNYTSFMLTDGSKFLTSKTLKKYDEMLTPHGFFRIHKSHLINLQHVKRFVKTDGGSVEMSDGSSLLISREKKDSFSKIFLQ